ncbi:3-keto-5-aminohexanoate cleavage protein [Enterococcus sp. JM4C]|uniref:3-keto-5-aminohexanoate cleavage protein n=1 Tax=Candidatus Enterococcus huntleyi TaxID=1857217 RepID=UPI00137B33E1|nr:3-keto-5-aminohexanoate cleavage protein [Enterococcus sp. JM4C]KAF1299408.1 3-keto-5-aminohexanoate cleavage protein [Enterococcus sp. JM4C]
MKKVIISLAPVAASQPIDYSKLADDISQSITNGAAICHLHSRNSEGQLQEDCTEMMECFVKVLSKTDVVVQASTGGISAMNIEQRCSPLEYKIVESCSLNGGSTNLGESIYKNSFSDIRYVAQKTCEKDIVPEIEVFDIGMIQAVEAISKETPFVTPKVYNLVFGHPGGMQATIENLIAFKRFVPEDCIWGVTHFGRTNWDFLACAISMGAQVVRIGFEDSDCLNSRTKDQATYNYELVERLAVLIRAIGYEVASANEARDILGIK